MGSAKSARASTALIIIVLGSVWLVAREASLQDFVARWFRGFQAEHDRPLWTELKVRAPMLFQKDFCTKNVAGKTPVASSMFSQAVCEQFRLAAHRDHNFLCLLKRIHKHAFELLPVA